MDKASQLGDPTLDKDFGEDILTESDGPDLEMEETLLDDEDDAAE